MKSFVLTVSFMLFNLTVWAQLNTLRIVFEHFIDINPMEVGKTYLNDFAEEFTPTNLKYYISNISFEDAKGNVFKVSSDYFLVDESDSTSKTLAVRVPTGHYKKVCFMVGVDSIQTISGVNEGALDPYHGMFWTWNTGFVSAKFEGVSPVSKLPQQRFEYHIGGFRTGQNSLRIVNIPLNDGDFHLNSNTTFRLKVDILKWFNGKHALKISEQSFIHNPGKIALMYADNYACMFELINITSH